MTDERKQPKDDGDRRDDYESPRVEELDTDHGPTATAAGDQQSPPPDLG